MRLDLQGSAVSRRAAVIHHVGQRTLFEFARYGDAVGTVRIRLTDRPPSAEHAYHCGVAVTVAQDDGAQRNVLARAEGDDVFRLIDSVLARASSLVGGEIARAAVARETRAQWMKRACVWEPARPAPGGPARPKPAS